MKKTDEAVGELENKLLRDRPDNPNPRVNPYMDGMADWPELIQGMSQHQRDEILDRVNKGKT